MNNMFMNASIIAKIKNMILALNYLFHTPIFWVYRDFPVEKYEK